MTSYPPVCELLPHAPPILALDELVSAEPGRATARVTLTNATQFVADGRLDSLVTLEYMAQTVAACLGFEATQEGRAVRVGMLVACRSMTILRPELRVGEVLHCDVARISGNESSSRFEGRTRDADDALVSKVEMTLVHAELPQN